MVVAEGLEAALNDSRVTTRWMGVGQARRVNAVHSQTLVVLALG